MANCKSERGFYEAAHHSQQLSKSRESALVGEGVMCVRSSVVDKLGIDERLRK